MNPYRDYSQLTFTCVNAAPSEVAACFEQAFNNPTPEQQARDGSRPNRYRSKPVALDLSLAYVDRPTARPRDDGILFWTPAGGFSPEDSPQTVFMCSVFDGRSFSVFRLAERTPWRWINIDIDDSHSVFYQGFRFQYHEAFRTINRDLRAGVGDNDKWFFEAQGEIMPFENPDYYRRRLKDRFGRQIIVEYLRNIGYDIEDHDFWTSRENAIYFGYRSFDE